MVWCTKSHCSEKFSTTENPTTRPKEQNKFELPIKAILTTFFRYSFWLIFLFEFAFIGSFSKRIFCIFFIGQIESTAKKNYWKHFFVKWTFFQFLSFEFYHYIRIFNVHGSLPVEHFWKKNFLLNSFSTKQKVNESKNWKIMHGKKKHRTN